MYICICSTLHVVLLYTQMLMSASFLMEDVTIIVLILMAASIVHVLMDMFLKETIPVVLV